MFHNDVQTQLSNKWKRYTSEHSINRIFTPYTDKRNRNFPANFQSNNSRLDINSIIQRQQAIRSFSKKPNENVVRK